MKTKFAVIFKETFESREEAEMIVALGALDSNEVEIVELEEENDVMSNDFVLSDDEWNELMTHENEVELIVPDYD